MLKHDLCLSRMQHFAEAKTMMSTEKHQCPGSIRDAPKRDCFQLEMLGRILT